MRTAVLVALLLLVSACGASGRAPAGAPAGVASSPSEVQTPATPGSATPSPTETSAAEPGSVIATYRSRFGVMLFDNSGQAVYLFDRERTTRPDCYGECAAAWPPVLTEGAPAAKGQVEPGLLGTTKRRDGSLQVTYAGHPLYYYAHEGERQVLCHNVDEYGGLWLVVRPDGTPAPG